MVEKAKPIGPVAPIQVISLERPDLLASPKRRGFHRRWIRNTEEDIERMEEIGYTTVKKGEGDDNVSRRELVLMEIPQAIYEERVRLKVAYVKERRRQTAKLASAETDRIVALGREGLSKTIGGVTTTEPTEPR